MPRHRQRHAVWHFSKDIWFVRHQDHRCIVSGFRKRAIEIIDAFVVDRAAAAEPLVILTLRPERPLVAEPSDPESLPILFKRMTSFS